MDSRGENLFTVANAPLRYMTAGIFRQRSIMKIDNPAWIS